MLCSRRANNNCFVVKSVTAFSPLLCPLAQTVCMYCLNFIDKPNDGSTLCLQILFGTAEFVAPEVVNYDNIDFTTDMWSVGVVCYLL